MVIEHRATLAVWLLAIKHRVTLTVCFSIIEHHDMLTLWSVYHNFILSVWHQATVTM